MVDQEGLVLVDDTFGEEFVKLFLCDLLIRINIRVKKDFSHFSRKVFD